MASGAHDAIAPRDVVSTVPVGPGLTTGLREYLRLGEHVGDEASTAGEQQCRADADKAVAVQQQPCRSRQLVEEPSRAGAVRRDTDSGQARKHPGGE